MPELQEKVEDISQITVSSKVLANIIGVSDRRIRQLADEGVMSRSSQGRYYLFDSLHDYILMLKVDNEAKNPRSDEGDAPNLDEEKAYNERAKRYMNELRLKRMQGELHNASDVKLVMTDMLAKFKAKTLGLPAKAAPVIENKDKTFINTYLRGEINLLLQDLSDYSPQDFYADEFIVQNEQEDDEDE